MKSELTDTAMIVTEIGLKITGLSPGNIIFIYKRSVKILDRLDCDTVYEFSVGVSTNAQNFGEQSNWREHK